MDFPRVPPKTKRSMPFVGPVKASAPIRYWDPGEAP